MTFDKWSSYIIFTKVKMFIYRCYFFVDDSVPCTCKIRNFYISDLCLIDVVTWSVLGQISNSLSFQKLFLLDEYFFDNCLKLICRYQKGATGIHGRRRKIRCMWCSLFLCFYFMFTFHYINCFRVLLCTFFKYVGHIYYFLTNVKKRIW